MLRPRGTAKREQSSRYGGHTESYIIEDGKLTRPVRDATVNVTIALAVLKSQILLVSSYIIATCGLGV